MRLLSAVSALASVAAVLEYPLHRSEVEEVLPWVMLSVSPGVARRWEKVSTLLSRLVVAAPSPTEWEGPLSPLASPWRSR